MNCRHRHFIPLILILHLFIPAISFSATPEPPEIPPGYVIDLADIISDDVETRLNAYLRELEEKTTAQVVVLTIESLDGEEIEEFSLRMAEKWRLGQKGKDNGLLLTVALKDRRYRFEVGYGLEGILPDSLVGSIGRQYLVPYFRKGDYSTGILNATIAIVSEIARHEGVEITGMPASGPIHTLQRSGNRKTGLLDAIFIILVSAFFIYLFIRHPHLLILFLLSPSGRGRWSGGFGGGGFGGFSGGGGGFGGGGASGRW